MFFRRRNRDLDDEIRAHLEMSARDRVQRGQSPSDAHLSALNEFGSEALVREITRGMWGWAWVERRAQDLRYAARQLRANPGFAAAAILTLALGIGANSAIFSVVNAVLLNSLPFPDSSRLVWAWGRFPGSNQAAVSPQEFQVYRAENHSFQRFGAFFVLAPAAQNWSLRGEARQLQGSMVTADFFEALGQSPLLGRGFTREDERADSPRGVVLSYRLWQEAYGGDPNVTGRTARMETTPVTIIGVMPASIDFPSGSDFWFPTPLLSKGLQNRRAHCLRAVGLLKPSVSIEQAQSDLNAISQRLAAQYPESNRGWSLRLEPLQEAIVGPSRPALLLLLGAVGLVLLIACVNIANLLLARYGARHREIAIRMSIGAGRGRILGQLLTESLLLAVVAGASALLIAWWGVNLVRGFGPQSIPRLQEVRLDARVLGFTALVSVITAVFFGLAPAWLATLASPVAGLREDSRAGGSRRRHALGAALVVGETALSICLLVGASLLIQSLVRTLHAPPGFTARGVVETKLLLSSRDRADKVRLLRRVDEAVRALPGVQAVGGISELPLNHEFNDTFFTIVEHPPRNPDDLNDEDFRSVTPGYFQAMGIPLLRGRVFDDRDGASSAPVVLVDEPFVRRYFPHEDPLGKHIRLSEAAEIVGVVGGVRNHSLRQPPRPTIYLAFAQGNPDNLHLLVRGTADAAALAGPIRRIVAAEDPDLALAVFRPMDGVLAESASTQRFDTLLLGLFATLALALAVAGVYGVFSYLVTQQTHQIGLRMALGAQPGRVLRLFLARGLRLAGLGAALGLVAAFFLTGALTSELYQVQPRDPLTYASAALVLIVVAMAACSIPAHRAMRVDPLAALRCD